MVAQVVGAQSRAAPINVIFPVRPQQSTRAISSSHLLFNNITYYCTIQSWDRHKNASRLTQGVTPFLRVVKLTGFSTDRPPPAPLPRGRSARPSKHTLSVPCCGTAADQGYRQGKEKVVGVEERGWRRNGYGYGAKGLEGEG